MKKEEETFDFYINDSENRTHYNFTDASCTEHVVCCENVVYRVKSAPYINSTIANNLISNLNFRFSKESFQQEHYSSMVNNSLKAANFIKMYTR